MNIETALFIFCGLWLLGLIFSLWATAVTAMTVTERAGLALTPPSEGDFSEYQKHILAVSSLKHAWYRFTLRDPLKLYHPSVKRALDAAKEIHYPVPASSTGDHDAGWYHNGSVG